MAAVPTVGVYRSASRLSATTNRRRQIVPTVGFELLSVGRPPLGRPPFPWLPLIKLEKNLLALFLTPILAITLKIDITDNFLR